MQIEQLAAKLENLGLNDKEAKVYVANLFLGPAPVQKIAEQAGINRATTYVILDQLSALGLVSQSVESKKTSYIAEGPEALERLFERQKSLIEERRKELGQLLPELQQLERSTKTVAPVVRFYRGVEGTKSVNTYLRRNSKPHSQIFGLSNIDELLKTFPDILRENPEYRVKKKMSSKMIYSWSEGNLPAGKKILRETKKLGQPAAADITLYEDRASFLTYADKDSMGIIIESKEIVAALRQLFELAWSSSKLKS